MERINVEDVSILVFELSDNLFCNYLSTDFFIMHTRDIKDEEDKFKEESFSEFMNFLLCDDGINFDYKKKSLNNSIVFYNNLHKRLKFLKEEKGSNVMYIRQELDLDAIIENVIKKARENLDSIISLSYKIDSLGNNSNNSIGKNKNKF